MSFLVPVICDDSERSGDDLEMSDDDREVNLRNLAGCMYELPSVFSGRKVECLTGLILFEEDVLWTEENAL